MLVLDFVMVNQLLVYFFLYLFVKVFHLLLVFRLGKNRLGSV